MQEEIIASVTSGRDTLALLPTGGGKSICFQVPGLMKEGICLVVSPLIALMKDQVSNLQKRGIKALCITSEYSPKEVDAMFDRCIYEDIRFLYLSPERLLTDMARTRIAMMKVNLIAVDEAHCISEWGYDFRPPYLKIADIRPLHPKVPVIALTASATPPVVKDIQEKLGFKKPNVFARSFERENLAYFIDWDEDKLGKTERIARKLKGSGIVYMRSRKGTERLARELGKRNLNADFYHAGLDSETRSTRQEAWMSGKLQIIVATNAFGMGIDKPDVRFVIHLDLPDTLENYYQECGRAGRDGKKSFAVSILSAGDVNRLREKLIDSFPAKKDIVRVYAALGNFLQLAQGSGKDERFPVDIERFAANFNFSERTVLQSLKFLEKEGYLLFEEMENVHSTVKILCSSEELYRLKLNNPKLEPLIDALLRSYTRLFDEEVTISEWTLAKRLKWAKDKVVKGLGYLHQNGHIGYRQASGLPSVTYVCERLDPRNVSISPEHYNLRKHIVTDKAEAMMHYVQNNSKCRSRMILEYFGERNARDCGQCDFCLKQ